MKKNLHIVDSYKLNQSGLRRLKRLSLLIMFYSLFVCSNFAQNDTISSAEINDKRIRKDEVSDNEMVNDTVNKKTEIIDEPIDTTILETNNKLYMFIEYEDRIVIDRIDLNTGEKKRVLDIGGDDCDPMKDTNRFRGHWSGIEVGLNNFMYDGFTFNSPPGYGYMDLKTFSSWNVNLNFAQLSIPFSSSAGLVTGLGYEMNFYRFRHDNSIQINDSTGIIEERVLEGEYNVRKSKFTTMHLTVPLLLEAQFRKTGTKEMFYISGGVIGGWNIASALKVKHKVDEDKQKIVERNADLNLNNFRAGVTFRIGSRDKNNNSSGFYATYYFTQLFEENMGPELYPVAIGFRIDF